jgi:SAM-dependent methyltransferase
MLKNTITVLLLIGSAGVFATDTMATKPMNHQGMDAHSMGMHGQHGDGGYHHRFQNAAEWAKKFDQPEREAWQKPEQILDALKLPANALVADVGAGTGYFSVRIAKRVPQGKVFAADLEPDMVSYLGERAKRENLNNINPVQASAESPNLSEPVDVVVFVDTYHHIGNRVDYFTKLNNSLKANGRLVLVDFRMDAPDADAPPKEHRVSIEKVTEELKAAGYKLTENYDFLPRQYFIVFQKIAK